MFRWMKARALGRLHVELAGLMAEQAEEAETERITRVRYPIVRAESARRIAQVREQIRQIYVQMGKGE